MSKRNVDWDVPDTWPVWLLVICQVLGYVGLFLSFMFGCYLAGIKL